MSTLRRFLILLLLVPAGCANARRAVIQPVAEPHATATPEPRDVEPRPFTRRLSRTAQPPAKSQPVQDKEDRSHFPLMQTAVQVPLPKPSPEFEPAVIPIEEAPEPDPIADASPDSEETHELTLEQLQGLAFAYNPTLEQARAVTWKERGRFIQAGLHPNPTVGYAAVDIGAEGKAGKQGMYVQQEIVTADKLDLNQAVAAWRQQQAQRALTAQEIRVQTAVRREYVAVLAAERMVNLAEELVKIGRSTLQNTTNVRDVGDASDIDVELSRVELERAELALVRAQAERDAAWQRLRAVVGAPGLKPTQLAGDIEATPPELSAEELWQRITSASPELAQARAGLARARAAVESAEAQVIPNIMAQAAPMYDVNAEEMVVDVQVGIALPIHNRNQGNIVTARADVVKAAREINRREQQLRRQMAVEFQQYEIARAQVERYRTRILPSTGRTLDLSRLAQEAQQFSSLQILTVQRTYTEANQQYVTALRDMWQSIASLEGMLLTDGLADPETGMDSSL